jgi:hypothetical protein
MTLTPHSTSWHGTERTCYLVATWADGERVIVLRAAHQAPTVEVEIASATPTHIRKAVEAIVDMGNNGGRLPSLGAWPPAAITWLRARLDELCASHDACIAPCEPRRTRVYARVLGRWGYNVTASKHAVMWRR